MRRESMQHRIQKNLEKLQKQKLSFGGKIGAVVKLFSLCVGFAFHRAMYLLFSSPTKSFALVHAQNTNGIYNASYNAHVRFTSGMRIFSATSLMVALTSTVIVFSIMQLFLPGQTAQPALAAETIIAVTNTDTVGAGSLPKALDTAHTQYGFDPHGGYVIEIQVTGTYTVADNLNLPSPVTIRVADGETFTMDGTGSEATALVIGPDAGAGSTIKDIVFSNVNTAIDIGAENVSVENVTINDAVTGVHVEGGTNAIITGSTFTNNDQGVYTEVSLNHGGTNNLTISNNTFTMPAGDTREGIILGGSTGTTISGNTISGGSACIRLAESDGNTVTANICTGSYTQGLNIANADTNTIGGDGAGDANHIYNLHADGLAIGIDVTEASINNVITGNYIGVATDKSTVGRVGQGVTVAGTGNSIENNVFGVQSDQAISISAASTTVSGNFFNVLSDGVTPLGTYASSYMIIGSDTGIVIQNNVFYGGSTGIEANEGVGTTISGNTFIKGGQGVSVNSGSGIVISGNYFGTNSSGVSGLGNTQDGVYVFDGSDYASPTSDVTISANTFTNNESYGVNIDDGSQGIEVTHNNFTHNALGNIYIGVNTISQPEITSITSDTIRGTGGLEGGRVEVYLDGQYTAEDTSISGGGAWEVTGTFTIPAVTTYDFALNIDANGNTSLPEPSDAEDYVDEEEITPPDDTTPDDTTPDPDTVPDETTPDSGDAPKSSDTVNNKKVLARVFGAERDHLRINGQFVFDKTARVAPGKVQLNVVDIDTGVQGRLIIFRKKKKGTTLVSSSTWDGYGKLKTDFTGEKNQAYVVNGKARTTNKKIATTPAALAEVEVTRAAPTLQTVISDVVVTTSVRNLLFDGTDGKDRAVQTAFINLADDSNLGVCQNPCSLPFEPASYGEYLAVTTSGKSASVQTKIVYVPASLTSMLNFDAKSAEYAYRLIATNSVTVTGIGTPGRVKLFIDGKEVASTTTTTINFSIPIDMSNLSVGEHVLTMRTYDTDGNERVSETHVIDFRKHPRPVDLLVSGAPQDQKVVSNTPLVLTVTGGAENRVHLFTSSTLVQSSVFERIGDTAQGQTSLELNVSDIGAHSYVLYAEDNYGIKTAEKVITYSVIAPAVVSVAPEVEDEEVDVTTPPTTPTDEDVTPATDAETTVDVAPELEGNDADNDGIPDVIEGDGDQDADGIPDFLDSDSDNDGIPDGVEGSGDTDGDSVPDYLDPDSDNDGIPDADESAVDVDGDGLLDFQDTDSDNDGIPDAEENEADGDGDGQLDADDTDDDNDGIPDEIEGDGDFDSDGVLDSGDTDADGDGIPDADENIDDSDNDGSPDYLDTDSDNDGIPDSIETNVDTDGDGVFDFEDVDSDNDGILDADEGVVDTDADGLADYQDPDSDNDGIADGDEDPADADGDGLTNDVDTDDDGDGIMDSEEGNGDTDSDGTPDALDPDSDNDGIPDSEERSGDADNDGIADFQDGVDDTYRYIQPFKPSWVPDNVKFSDPRVHVIDELIDGLPDNTIIEIDDTVWNIPVSALRLEYDTVQQAAIAQTLNSANRETLDITPIASIVDVETGSVISGAEVVANEAGGVVLRNTRLTGVQPMPLTRFLEPQVGKSEIVYSGVTTPYALVLVQTNSDPIVKVTRADEEGRWTITVPVDAIGEGEHTAQLQSSFRGVDSDKIEIAKFVVVEDRRLSNTTWIFIINIVVALILILAVVVIQMRKRGGGTGGSGQNIVARPMATSKPVEQEETQRKTGSLGV